MAQKNIYRQLADEYVRNRLKSIIPDHDDIKSLAEEKGRDLDDYEAQMVADYIITITDVLARRL